MDFSGMTVNERLYASGKSTEFYKAVEKKSVKEVIRILKAVDLKSESIKPILESLGFEKDDAEL